MSIFTLAVALLIYQGVVGIWDLLDPDAMKIDFGSPFRALVAFCAVIANVVLLLTIVSASAALIVGIISGVIILGLVKALADA